jgi:cytochrome c
MMRTAVIGVLTLMAICAALTVLQVAGGDTPSEAACNAERGQALFVKCAICHTNDASGAHSVGPNLHGIIGRRIAAAQGFAYTDALKSYGKQWSLEKLDRFIADPLGEVPGAAMAFAGLKKPDDRRDLLCYLESASGK